MGGVYTRLLEMAYGDELRKKSAYELLGEIDQWRLASGKPDFEPRHPNISSGYSWPILEPEEKDRTPASLEGRLRQ